MTLLLPAQLSLPRSPLANVGVLMRRTCRALVMMRTRTLVLLLPPAQLCFAALHARQNQNPVVLIGYGAATLMARALPVLRVCPL